MLPTYKAILRGNHVEWLGDGDQQPALDDPVAVNITILDEPVAPEGVERRGKLMAAALERLAEIKALPDVADPALWEREIRQDRVIPDADGQPHVISTGREKSNQPSVVASAAV